MALKTSSAINYVASGMIMFGGLCGIFLRAHGGGRSDAVMGYGLLAAGAGLAVANRVKQTTGGRRALGRIDKLIGYVTSDNIPPTPHA